MDLSHLLGRSRRVSVNVFVSMPVIQWSILRHSNDYKQGLDI